jgi:hypothetical protein
LTSQPTLVAPASFIASPIYRGSRRIGTLIFKLPLDAITDVMSQRQGLGRTGECYLIGQDHLMRSDSYKSPTEHSVDGSFRNATKVDSRSILKALIDDSVGKVNVESQLVTKSGTTLFDIVAQVDNVSQIVNEISSGTIEQSAGIDDVNHALNALRDLTQQNTSMVDEAAAASSELSSQAQGMANLIRFFND